MKEIKQKMDKKMGKRIVNGMKVYSCQAALLKALMLMLVFGIIFSGAVFGGGTAEAAESKKVKVGFTDMENFLYGSGDNTYKSGYAYEYLQKISYYTGWEYEYVYASWPELIEMLVNGEIDIMPGMIMERAGSAGIVYSREPIGYENVCLFTLWDSYLTEDNLADYKLKIGCVVEPYMKEMTENWVNNNLHNAGIVLYNSEDELIAALEAGEIDAVITNENLFVGKHSIRTLADISTTYYYLGVSEKREELAEEAYQALQKEKRVNPDFLNELRKKYYGNIIAGGLLTDQEVAWSKNHTELKVGYIDDYMPFSYTNSDGDADGLVRDIFDYIQKNILVSSEIIYVAFDGYSDMLDGLRDHKVDVVFPVIDDAWYSEQNGILQSNVVVEYLIDGITVGNGNVIEDTDIIAIVRGNASQKRYVNIYYPQHVLLFCNSIEECMRAVQNGEAGFTLVNTFMTESLVRADSDFRYVHLPDPDAICIGTSRDNLVLLSMLNRGILMMGEKEIGSSIIQNLEKKDSMSIGTFMSVYGGTFITLLIVLVIIFLALFFKYLYTMRETNNKLFESENDLKKQTEELKRTNKELEEEKRLSDEAAEKAQKANEAKSTFLFNMSHDIRTPMNAVLGYNDLARKNIDSDTKAALQYLQKISIAGNQLLNLINNILEVSKIENGKDVVAEEPAMATHILTELIPSFYKNASEKNVKFTINDQTDGLCVYCDRLKIQRVVSNLVSNAIKYTKAKGFANLTIRTKEHEEPGWVYIETIVEDNGIGMSEEFQKTMFERFTRETTVTESGIIGTGLGLSITLELIKLMNGTIDVKSAEKQGTTIVATIPHRLADKSAIVVKNEKPYRKNPKIDYRQVHILVAEDNDMNAEIILQFLEKELKCKCDLVPNGKAAVDKVALSQYGNNYYDLIFMDIQMPIMDGYEATKHIRAMKEQRLSETPIIAMTANAYEEDRRKAESVGMDGHIAKPIDLKIVQQTMDKYLTKFK